MTTSIRTNAHPVILASNYRGTVDAMSRVIDHRRDNTGNIILDFARDLYEGDTFNWAMDLLFATQELRMAYDSPRIGGGIDPALATNLPGLEAARLDCYTLAYIIGSPDQSYHGDDETYDPESMGAFDDLELDYIQDCIVHAEAVAGRLVNLCRIIGTSY